LLISNHNSFRVLFDKIVSVYFIWKKLYLYFSIRYRQPREPALCQLYRHTFIRYSRISYVGLRGSAIRRLRGDATDERCWQNRHAQQRWHRDTLWQTDRQTDSDTGASPLSGLPYKEVKQSTESLAARGAPSLAPPPHQRCADHLLPHRIDFAPRGIAALPLW